MSLLSPQLEAFLAVARLKTVHAAARELGITQTGVTQRLRALEANLAATFFVRSRRGMLLNAEGEALYRYCLSARDLEGPVLARIQGAGKTSSFSVCVTGPTSVMRTRVVPTAAELMKQFPGLLLQCKLVDSPTWIDDLRSGAAQLALVRPELVAKELESKMLKPEQYLMVGPAAWKGRTFLDIVKKERIIDFDPSDQTSFEYLRRFKMLDYARTERLFLNNNEGLASLIEAGLGYGVLTRDFAERFLQRCKIVVLNQGKIYEQALALTWYARPSSEGCWPEIIRAIR
jgi:LysR family transcriptional regulator (chromosome initiation inhibitor)